MTRTSLFHISGNQYFPFPSEHHTKHIWEELAKGVDDYHVIARGKTNRYSYTREGKIHLHLLPSLGDRMWVFLFLSWILPWFILRYRPTHLLVQCPVLGGLAASLCAKLFHLPIFVEIHGSHYFAPVRSGLLGRCEFLFYRLLSPITFSCAKRIRSLSEEMTSKLLEVYGNKLKNKIVTIPTRVDLTVFKLVKSSYLIGDVLKVITVGAFSPTKNHCQLINDLYHSGIPFTLTIVGRGVLENEYLRLASELGISDKVHIAGQLTHSELSALLITHDIYIHYSLSEGLSRAILEAMAAGLPTITTRVGYIGGVLNNFENSIVLDSPWAEELSKSLNRLLGSESLRQKIGQAGRKTIEEKFESNHVFDLYRKSILSSDNVISVKTI